MGFRRTKAVSRWEPGPRLREISAYAPMPYAMIKPRTVPATESFSAERELSMVRD